MIKTSFYVQSDMFCILIMADISTFIIYNISSVALVLVVLLANCEKLLYQKNHKSSI